MGELTPYICVADARAAIDWYVDVLGAEVTYEPIVMDDGRVGHVELAVDGAGWMMSDEFESAGVAAPDPRAGQRGVAAPRRSRTSTPCARGSRGRVDARPRAGGQPTGRAGGGLPRPVRAPVVPQPAALTTRPGSVVADAARVQRVAGLAGASDHADDQGDRRARG